MAVTLGGVVVPSREELVIARAVRRLLGR